MDILAILNRIEALLRESGASKSDLYSACSLSASAVSQWKSGRTRPSTKSLQRIADYLHVSYEYLISGTGEKEKAPTLESGQVRLESTYLRLAQGAQELGLDDEDVDAILAIYAKHKQKNQ